MMFLDPAMPADRGWPPLLHAYFKMWDIQKLPDITKKTDLTGLLSVIKLVVLTRTHWSYMVL